MTKHSADVAIKLKLPVPKADEFCSSCGAGAGGGHDTYVYVYACSPVDWWNGWKNLEMTEFGYKLVKATFAVFAVHPHWEGDAEITIGPLVSQLPYPMICGTTLLIALKVANNGTTFFASRVPLPWLDEEIRIPTGHEAATAWLSAAGDYAGEMDHPAGMCPLGSVDAI
jgi:hypothetical protein